MTLEEVKEWASYIYSTKYVVEPTVMGGEHKAKIDWLISEVELMQKQLDFIEEEGEVKATAQRCAEIADSFDEYDYADEVSEAIRKEFRLSE